MWDELPKKTRKQQPDREDGGEPGEKGVRKPSEEEPVGGEG